MPVTWEDDFHDAAKIAKKSRITQLTDSSGSSFNFSKASPWIIMLVFI